MILRRTNLKRFLFAIGLTVSAGALASACGGDSTGSHDAQPVEVAFHGTSDLLPNLDFDTGLLPDGSPVQASFALSAHGDATVSAAATPSGSAGSPTLTGLPGRGTVDIDGAFALDGRLKVDISGLPSYDGPIPGIENVKIAIQGKEKFDPFSIHHPVKARADIPATKLPPIPLPGGLPGHLVLEVVEGSFVELTFTGTCAGADDKTATYSGGLERAGTLVIQPSVEVDVPIVGTQTFMIPKFSVDLALGGSQVDMSAKISELGAEPAKGDSVTGSCSPKGSGGGGGAGGGAGGGVGGADPAGTGGGATSTSASGSGGGSLGGICESGASTGDMAVDDCINQSCCDDFGACTFEGADVQGCLDCVNAGGGARCNGFLGCWTTNCGG